MKYSPRQMGGVKRARTQPKKGDKGRISKRKRSAREAQATTPTTTTTAAAAENHKYISRSERKIKTKASGLGCIDSSRAGNKEQRSHAVKWVLDQQYKLQAGAKAQLPSGGWVGLLNEG